MNDDPAQSSKNSHADGTQTRSQSGQASAVPSAPVAPLLPSQPVSALPNKEQAPISEHVQVSDAVESQPELHPELKEYGVDVRTDEAKLELTREHQNLGMQHSPHSQNVKEVLEPQKSEFPMGYQMAKEESKKSSVWSSLRWLATYVLRQMKIKKIAEETAK